MNLVFSILLFKLNSIFFPLIMLIIQPKIHFHHDPQISFSQLTRKSNPSSLTINYVRPTVNSSTHTRRSISQIVNNTTDTWHCFGNASVIYHFCCRNISASVVTDTSPPQLAEDTYNLPTFARVVGPPEYLPAARRVRNRKVRKI